MVPPVNYGVKCMSMGFLMKEDVAAVWRGPMARTPAYPPDAPACLPACRWWQRPTQLASHCDVYAAHVCNKQVMSALDTFITKVRWSPLDVLVIDMPPGTGDAQITISQRLNLSGAVIVSTPQARRGSIRGLRQPF